MEIVTNKAEILSLIKYERAKLEDALVKIPEDKLTASGVESTWSVKDILAHIAAWERLMVGWVEASLRGETPDRPAPGESWDDLDGMNERLYQAHKDQHLRQVLADFEDSYKSTLDSVERLSEEELLDSGRFAWRRGDPMWRMVAANTWWHYKEHRETIERWLGSGEA